MPADVAGSAEEEGGGECWRRLVKAAGVAKWRALGNLQIPEGLRQAAEGCKQERC